MSINWRDQILKEFIPGLSRLIIVADPDGLLLEEGILKGLQERNFELIPFEDHVAFRYTYESRFRSHWDRGEETDQKVVLRLPSSDFNALPYDLLQAGRKVSLSLGDIFPNLNYSVVAALDRCYFDALFEAQLRVNPKQLGENDTKDFILSHVFKIVPELIKEPEDLLRVLLRRHYRGQHIPAILDERLIQLLQQNNKFKYWPLKHIIPNREAFFAFLQERWPVFLDSLVKLNDNAVYENMTHYNLKFQGPALLPFDHEDIRIYIDNLFFEGLLQPVAYEKADAFARTWVIHGIKISPMKDHLRRIEGLLNSIVEALSLTEVRYKEWFHIAYQWAELLALALKQDLSLPEEYCKRLERLRNRLDAAFTTWVIKSYASLINLPPAPPVVLHHLPRYLARILADNHGSKVAYLVLDGLALDQWIILREVLKELNSGLHFRENAVFAWIPTITSVSRQAAFAGKPPVYFPASIHTTNKEPNLWLQFWVNQGLSPNEIGYAKGLDDEDMDKVSKLLSCPRLRVVGLVINKVDQIMHGMKLGLMGIHNQIRQWTRQGFMNNLFNLLQSQGFQIYLTSDHGNIEAKGIGHPTEGAIADLRGERVRVYSDPKIRAQIKEQFPGSLEWPPIGLPENYLALIAPNRSAFVREGKTIISHGGISIEELIVPFVQIDRRKQ